ncbi:MAG: pimeloyl-CoA dehydrogenase large subunit [Tistrella sp.]|jgi:alkylation response protein AidB-like acyl-CoA dehydrogenase|uniref:Pimeloyl-CoA dehydrogenase large subunit n=1 Tax=Tistrella mobilis TaxID=171437 RepID=A0A162JTL1_9PROT|nr:MULTISPECIES: acyl-CoA dehydrogenase family protein [Tistrella]KYO49862.1 pimeloyl-CoA dehydrogenase large subunit [Tistrella mobilis]MAD35131.1 pimeloyl-CoA dehydrogenase large subunit [Tistrella sp.]MAM77172.1 pimeloyl-CoA dehydrogenase large subunit [Tistrella sp.]MBA77010.1 pimeloyl-CoA dehydrogenase large subunit [Tistrella sp.]HAE50676.1 pimeloyl-CoA dehydrogenase large subunit [Tistrella mobilis]
MKLTLSAEDQAFREEVREFMRTSLPEDIKARFERSIHLPKEDFVRWQKILYNKGWIAPAWPKEYGGTGWDPIKRYIFDQEMNAAGAPPPIAFAFSMVGPVLYTFANQAQKDHFLPRILSSEDFWCQGFSEPGSGSDLASLKTRAVRDGDEYVVNGSKIWTTLGQYADWIFCLVRTDSTVKKQEGISFLLIDMKTPGISVTPIITIDGGHEVNQVFFEDVRVPVENLVGEEGKGWTYAKFLLSHERTGIAGVGRSRHQLRKLKALAAKEVDDEGRPLIENARFMERLAAVEIELMALDATVMRMITTSKSGRPGPESSLLKIKGTEIQQAITELLLEAVGPYAQPYLPESQHPGWNGEPISSLEANLAAPYYLNWRKSSIYGGSNEIQKNIIAKAFLGL